MTLRGRGKPFWPVGILMAVGGLTLAGLPFGPMDEGFKLIELGAKQAGHGWITLPILFSAALTGAAVLRIAGRIFAGWGKIPGHEQHGETEDEHEPGEQPVSLLAGPAAVLLVDRPDPVGSWWRVGEPGGVGDDGASRAAAAGAAGWLGTVDRDGSRDRDRGLRTQPRTPAARVGRRVRGDSRAPDAVAVPDAERIGDGLRPPGSRVGLAILSTAFLFAF